jgi:hypothetical protein
MLRELRRKLAKTSHIGNEKATWPREAPRAIENYRRFLDLCKDDDPGLPDVADARQLLAGLTGICLADWLGGGFMTST